MQTPVVADTALRDPDPDTASAIIAAAPFNPWDTGTTGPEASIAAAAEVRGSDPNTAASVVATASFASEVARVVKASIVADTTIRHSDTDTAAAVVATVACASRASIMFIDVRRRDNVMMKPGTLDGDGDWVESQSMARSIENEMISDSLIDLNSETHDATQQRRKTIIAMSRGIINHIKTNLDIQMDAGVLRSASEISGGIPSTSKNFTVASGQITVSAGALRGANDASIPVPPTTRTLSGKVS